MASSSRPTLTELQPPDDEAAIARSFEGYRLTLETMTRPELLAELTRINAALEAESRSKVIQTAMQPLTDFISNLDAPVLRLRPTARPSSPRDRGAAHSRPSSPQPSPLDLLFGSRGRGLAAKLVAANARSINGRARRR